jgi:hypothetical protein
MYVKPQTHSDESSRLTSRPARVQYYPFVKGTAFRFINCKFLTKTEINPGDNSQRAKREDKEMCALLPAPPGKTWPGRAGDEGKKYPAWDAAKAKHNAENWAQYIKLLEAVVGEKKVEQCDHRQETDVTVQL